MSNDQLDLDSILAFAIKLALDVRIHCGSALITNQEKIREPDYIGR